MCVCVCACVFVCVCVCVCVCACVCVFIDLSFQFFSGTLQLSINFQMTQAKLGPAKKQVRKLPPDITEDDDFVD